MRVVLFFILGLIGISKLSGQNTMERLHGYSKEYYSFQPADSGTFIYPNDTVVGGISQLNNPKDDRTVYSQLLIYEEASALGFLNTKRQLLQRDSAQHTIMFSKQNFDFLLSKWVSSIDTQYYLNSLNKDSLAVATIYDNKGNVSSKVWRSFCYDSKGRMVKDSSYVGLDTANAKPSVTISYVFTDSLSYKYEKTYDTTSQLKYLKSTIYDAMQRTIWFESKYRPSGNDTLRSIFHDEYIYVDSLHIMYHYYVNNYSPSANFLEKTIDSLDLLANVRTTIVQKANGTSWDNLSKRTETWNNNLLIQELTFAPVFQKDTWRLGSEKNYTYNTNQQLLDHISAYYSGDTLSTSTKWVYLYNTKGNLLSIEELGWAKSSSNFEPGSTIRYTWEELPKQESIDSSGLTIYPNPFDKDLNFSFFAYQAGWAHITVLDVQGRLVDTYDAPYQMGRNRLTYQRQLSSGVYYISIYTREFQRAEMLRVN